MYIRQTDVFKNNNSYNGKKEPRKKKEKEKPGFCFVFEAGFLCAAMAVLELTPSVD